MLRWERRDEEVVVVVEFWLVVVVMMGGEEGLLRRRRGEDGCGFEAEGVVGVGLLCWLLLLMLMRSPLLPW